MRNIASNPVSDYVSTHAESLLVKGTERRGTLARYVVGDLAVLMLVERVLLQRIVDKKL